MVGMNGEEKTALVTGASSGLGKAVAIALAAMGYSLAIVSRNRERGQLAQGEIMARSGSDRVYLYVADLSSQAAIRKLAAEVEKRFARLTLLINNAGSAFPERRVSADGIELALAVNHLAPFLLTNLLLERLRASTSARIVNVGTRVDTRMEFDDLQWERRRYRTLSAYAQSKLGMLHFTVELARRLAGERVTVNCVFPGIFRSNLGKTDGAFGVGWKLIEASLGWSLPTSEQAAERVVYCATSEEMEGVSGAYYGNKKAIALPDQVKDPDANRFLWRISEQLCGLSGQPTAK